MGKERTYLQTKEEQMKKYLENVIFSLEKFNRIDADYDKKIKDLAVNNETAKRIQNEVNSAKEDLGNPSYSKLIQSGNNILTHLNNWGTNGYTANGLKDIKKGMNDFLTAIHYAFGGNSIADQYDSLSDNLDQLFKNRKHDNEKYEGIGNKFVASGLSVMDIQMESSKIEILGNALNMRDSLAAIDLELLNKAEDEKKNEEQELLAQQRLQESREAKMIAADRDYKKELEEINNMLSAENLVKWYKEEVGIEIEEPGELQYIQHIQRKLKNRKSSSFHVPNF